MTIAPSPVHNRAMKPFSIGKVRIDPPLALAPMAEVTDTYYRSLVKELGGVGLVVSEFISAEGLTRDNARTKQMLAYSEADRVSLSVGFYYMANACGRLLGTLLSGLLYQIAGVSASLWGAVVLAAAAGIGAMFLPPVSGASVSWAGAKGDD